MKTTDANAINGHSGKGPLRRGPSNDVRAGGRRLATVEQLADERRRLDELHRCTLLHAEAVLNASTREVIQRVGEAKWRRLLEILREPRRLS